MQHEGNRHLEEIINAADDHVRRTTIILEKKERDFIDSLIREGKEPGIKPLISKMLNIYKNMMINEWRFPGEYYYGISRVAFINVEILNILIQQLSTEKLYETGKNIGSALKVSLETTFGLRNDEDWEEIFYRLKIQGFGDFYLKDKYILLKSPFVNYSELWRGILESLFGVKLDAKSSVPPLVFEIRAHSQTG